VFVSSLHSMWLLFHVLPILLLVVYYHASSVLSAEDLAGPNPNQESDADELLVLNVGGTLFTTTRETVRRHARIGGRLANALTGRPTLHDAQGNLFFDRDPAIFNMLLGYMRYGVWEDLNFRAGDGIPTNRGLQVFDELNYFGLMASLETYRQTDLIKRIRNLKIMERRETRLQELNPLLTAIKENVTAALWRRIQWDSELGSPHVLFFAVSESAIPSSSTETDPDKKAALLPFEAALAKIPHFFVPEVAVLNNRLDMELLGGVLYLLRSKWYKVVPCPTSQNWFWQPHATGDRLNSGTIYAIGIYD